MSREKPCADGVLQLANLHAEPLLANADLVRCAGKVLLILDGEDVAQPPNIDVI